MKQKAITFISWCQCSICSVALNGGGQVDDGVRSVVIVVGSSLSESRIVSILGALPLRVFGGAVQVSQSLSRASLQANPSVPLFAAATWQQTRHGSFFNKCKSSFDMQVHPHLIQPWFIATCLTSFCSS